MPRVLSISSVVVAMARMMRGGVMTGRIAMERHIRMMRREATPTSSICQTSMIRRTWMQRLSYQAHIAQPFLLVNHGLLPADMLDLFGMLRFDVGEPMQATVPHSLLARGLYDSLDRFPEGYPC
jgi:hypothetical protein